jgi:hypothetical protein
MTRLRRKASRVRPGGHSPKPREHPSYRLACAPVAPAPGHPLPVGAMARRKSPSSTGAAAASPQQAPARLVVRGSHRPPKVVAAHREVAQVPPPSHMLRRLSR